MDFWVVVYWQYYEVYRFRYDLAWRHHKMWNERPTTVGYTPGQVLIPPFVAILDRNQSKQELQKSFFSLPPCFNEQGNCWSIDVRMVFRRFLGPASSSTLILILLWQCAYTQAHLCQLVHLFLGIALSLVSLHQTFAVVSCCLSFQTYGSVNTRHLFLQKANRQSLCITLQIEG